MKTNSPSARLSFQLDLRSGVPAYRQLIDQVLGGIASGALQSGDQLPTVRQAAVEALRQLKKLNVRPGDLKPIEDLYALWDSTTGKLKNFYSFAISETRRSQRPIQQSRVEQLDALQRHMKDNGIGGILPEGMRTSGLPESWQMNRGGMESYGR